MTTYRIAPGGRTPEGWVVVPTSPENASPVQSFDTKAEAEAARRNAWIEGQHKNSGLDVDGEPAAE